MSNRNVNCNKPYLKIWRARFLSSKRWYSTVRFITGVIYLLRLQISELREIVCVCVRVFSCVCTIRVLCDDRGVCLTNIPVNFWNCGCTAESLKNIVVMVHIYLLWGLSRLFEWIVRQDWPVPRNAPSTPSIIVVNKPLLTVLFYYCNKWAAGKTRMI